MFRFLVTGVERSGTTWAAQLLDYDPTIDVVHEPDCLRSMDAKAIPVYNQRELDIEYFVRSRYSYWARVRRTGELEDYAEVNSRVRFAAGQIRDDQHVPVVAVIRDGRLTIRSLVAHRYYQRPDLPSITAPVEDPLAACSWYWAEAYRRLIEADINVVRLEDLNQHYQAVKALAEVLKCTVPEERWYQMANRPANVSILSQSASPWTEEQLGVIDSWAGDILTRFGYEGGR